MQAQILIPLDGSALAEGILPAVLPLAHATGSGVTLAQVVSARPPGTPLPGIAPAAQSPVGHRPMAAEQAYAHLVDVAGRLQRCGQSVQITVLAGDPATAVVGYATAHPEVHQIAMVTHGRTGLPRWIFGSVAETVLRLSPVPVLLARLPHGAPPGAPQHVYKTILVPLDGSCVAERALAEADALARATAADLVLLGAVADSEYYIADQGGIPLWRMPGQYQAITELGEYLEEIGINLATAGRPVSIRMATDPLAAAIVRVSAEVDADLIVMATHARAGADRWRQGSVAWQVLQDTTRPLSLLCPAPDHL